MTHTNLIGKTVTAVSINGDTVHIHAKDYRLEQLGAVMELAPAGFALQKQLDLYSKMMTSVISQFLAHTALVKAAYWNQ